MSKVKCFVCQKADHYASQCSYKKKRKATQEAEATSTKIDDFAKRFEKEFSLFTYISGSGTVVYEDSGLWLVDNAASSHITGMRSLFCSVSKADLDCSVTCGISTTHAVKGVVCVIFQRELGRFLEVSRMLFVLGLMI